MNEKLDIMDFKKPNNLSEEDWQHLFVVTRDMKKPEYQTEEAYQTTKEWAYNFLENGHGPCAVCGNPSWMKVFDMVEVTKPADQVINFEFIRTKEGRVSFAFCPEHQRESIAIRRDGTHELQTFGENDEPTAS